MRYAELHCKTNFSFLEGASHADELVARAKELDYTALAVTDRNSLAGVVRAHIAAKEQGLPLVIGAEVHPTDACPVVLWTTDRKSYGRLSRLLTVGRRRAEKGACRLTLDDIAQHAEGLIAGVLPVPPGEGKVGRPRHRREAVVAGRPETPVGGNLPSWPLSSVSDLPLSPQRQQLALQVTQRSPPTTPSAWCPGGARSDLPYRDIFADRAYLLAELFRGPDDTGRLQSLLALSRQSGLPLVAAGGVHYHTAARQPLHEVLTATRLGTTVDRLAEARFPNAQRHLQPLADIRAAFALAPAAVSRTLEIAARCTFSLDELRYEYPEELAPSGFTPSGYLAHLAWEGAHQRYPAGVPGKVRELLEHELQLIRELKYEAYFLTVWDLVRFARSRDILCQGRGSAANSAVCFCLGVTSVDPSRTDVLFERFISAERNEAPDIDVDFEHERREEVLQYLYDKYGRERAGMTAVVITYRTKSAIRDVGKALGLSLDRVDALAKNAEGRELDRYFNATAKTDKHEDPTPPGERVQGSGFRVQETEESPRSKVQGPKSGADDDVHSIKYSVPSTQHTSVQPLASDQPISHSLPPPLAPSPDARSPIPDPRPPTPVDILARRCAGAGIDPTSPLGQRLIYLVSELVGFPRHLSQHVGGMVITQGPLCELAPIENAAMPGRTVIEWDKDDLDELGILKVDCLCLGMLTAIRKAFALIERHYGDSVVGTLRVPSLPEPLGSTDGTPTHSVGAPVPTTRLTLATVPAEDSRVYDMICEADTIGVFQIESRAQMSMLPRLRPRRFYDLVIEVAIVRPGPIQGNMVHPYLRRRQGEAVPPYPTPEIEHVLERTLGVPLFQEQAMQLAVVAAGFTPGEADQLRRAMGAWRRPGVIDQFRKKLIRGMTERSLTPEFAEQVFNQIRGFGEYGFPESHAASFALLVYVSAWLKRYYPAVFCAAIINSQPMGFYAPSQLIRDARQHGVQVLPVDVNASAWDCTLEGRVQGSGFGVQDEAAEENAFALRLGFRVLTGIPQAAVERIVAARQQRAFQSLDDLARRARLPPAIVTRLAEADVFGSLALDRRTALWQALSQEKGSRKRPLLAGLADDEPPAELPPMPMLEQVFADYRTSGLSLKAHPLSFFREQLDALRVTPAGHLLQVRHGRHLRVAGIVLLRQRPGTARGITFVTLEDETGLTNLVLRPEIWERYYPIARRSPAWIAHGCLERKDTVIHLVVNRLEDLSARLGDLSTRSRDFR